MKRICILVLAGAAAGASWVLAAPAARVNDFTDHPGGRIVQGSPNVFIGGLPAARLSDRVNCPVIEPPGIPHVGGPIATGSSTVFINGLPAARAGDLVTENLRPSRIATGSNTVNIGG
jgi:uncharacterized Zn-binding protein involved in type VI secretion